VGQCALEKERILLTDVPGDYVRINSGLGESPPLNIIVLPILFEGSVRAVVELASFNRFSPTHQAFLDQLTESIGLLLNTIEANTLTENLLKQSQLQAHELQVSSRYKSEFFSNMSHELRTPLNSLLILASELAENREENLTDSQVQYAEVIHSSGTDLLRLLDDVLDLAKVESGTVTLQLGELPLAELQETLEREFSAVAEQKGVGFSVRLEPGLPATIGTDPGRLRQILKNLLANAFKFTERGDVSLTVSRDGPALAFRVTDTGIGITLDLQRQTSTRSRRPTARPPGNTGARGSGSRSAASWSACSTARSPSAACPEREARSPSRCRRSRSRHPCVPSHRTRRGRRWRAPRCSWSMTTSATSSPSPRCSSAAI
jgi:signal transduction histidine kinase